MDPLLRAIDERLREQILDLLWSVRTAENGLSVLEVAHFLHRQPDFPHRLLGTHEHAVKAVNQALCSLVVEGLAIEFYGPMFSYPAERYRTAGIHESLARQG